jgi:hypothetical protein
VSEASAAAAVAAASAQDSAGEAAWLARRATHLLDGDLAGYRPLLALANAPRAPVWTLVIPFGLGAFANYLGPSEQIHVLYNPIAVLVAWNLAIYALLVLTPILWRRRQARTQAATDATSPRPSPASPAAASATASATARPTSTLPAPTSHTYGVGDLLLRRLVPTFVVRLRRVTAHGAQRAARAATVGRRFWSLWLDTAPALPVAALRRMLHLAAAVLAVGAVVGMFVRGVFFEYAVVWRSTFVRDPATIATVLHAVLGPAAAVLGQPPPTVAEATQMMDAAGSPAARWIGLWALTAGLFVVLPRSLLALAATWRHRAYCRRLVVALDDPYYATCLAGVRRLQIARIEEAIGTDVARETATFADTVAGFVCERLYDERLVPALRAFRDRGGRVTDLEADMAAGCTAFEPELEAYLTSARADLEAALRAAIGRTIGERFGLTASGAGADLAARGLARDPLEHIGNAVGREISNAVGAAVTTGVSLVVASLSGGFGHHLGAAILVTLLHTTGPVGFLIGGLGGLVAAVAGWYVGRERLTAGIKGMALPGPLARLALREGALNRLIVQGRTQCRDAVGARIAAELAPLVPQLAEATFAQVRTSLPVAGR